MKKKAENIEDIISQLKEEKALLSLPKEARKRSRRSSKARAEYGGRRARGIKPWQTEAARRAHNSYEKRKQATVGGAYELLQRSYRYRNKDKVRRGIEPVPFLLSLEDWKKLWRNAPMVRHRGVEKAAFYARGIMPEDVQLWRIDETKPWRLDNCVVMWQGRAIVNGRELA